MVYEEWLARVPDGLRKDPIWQFEAYPKALWLFDLMWEDGEKLLRDARGREIVKQLVRSAGSITANAAKSSPCSSPRSIVANKPVASPSHFSFRLFGI